MSVRLYDIAHARAGDKGNLITIAVIPYDPDRYPRLCSVLTAQRVADHLAERVAGDVVRHRLDNLPALIFVCPRAADDTVTTSLFLDSHGKSLGSALLELELEWDAEPEGAADAAPNGGPNER
ncbi:hypothetical protein FZ103_15670 [Streptomonospora sp. PA3]|uniref:AtuA-related protein n=1 Tax=Streptomonospora sp. PA3 TaxID=2607326 RepID=UPI0012DE4A82|nr:hypothetical protein [Streptomonospora sp. PA3]MUL42593.1 hypothetical protein [Streptomonospora sp. PA3]